MAVVAAIGLPAYAINYTFVTDTSADFPSVANNTYFYNKADKLVRYKNANGNILEIFTLSGGGSTTSYGLFSQTANGTSVTGVAEQSILGAGVGTLSIPANAFSVGDSFTCALDGQLSSLSSATIHIHVKTLSGVILADTGIVPMAAATDKPWLLSLFFTVRTLGGAGTASISSGGLFSYIRNGGTQFEGFVLNTINSTTFDTTINNTLVVTAQWNSGSASNQIQSYNFILQKVY